MRSRIALFEWYNSPFGRAPRRRKARRMGFSPRTLPAGMGAPLFNNPRMHGYGAHIYDDRSYTTIPNQLMGYGAPLFENPRVDGLGRRAYTVGPKFRRRYTPGDGRGGYGPPSPKRRGYSVKRKRNTAAMKKSQAQFKKAAKKCSRSSRNKRKGAYQSCMRKALKSKRSRR